MRDRRLIAAVCWTVGLVLWSAFYFAAVGVIGAASLLGCEDECQRGEDWAWQGLAISCLVGTVIAAALMVIGWCTRTRRMHLLFAATIAMSVASVAGIVSLLVLDDGRGAPPRSRALAVHGRPPADGAAWRPGHGSTTAEALIGDTAGTAARRCRAILD